MDGRCELATVRGVSDRFVSDRHWIRTLPENVENTKISNQAGAESGAFCNELKMVIQAWPTLDQAVRESILRLVIEGS